MPGCQPSPNDCGPRQSFSRAGAIPRRDSLTRGRPVLRAARPASTRECGFGTAITCGALIDRIYIAFGFCSCVCARICIAFSPLVFLLGCIVHCMPMRIVDGLRIVHCYGEFCSKTKKMSSERAIPKIFETYSHLMEPVFDESGVLKAASFMFEAMFKSAPSTECRM